MAGGAQFLNIHLDRGFARDIDDQLARVAQLRADGGGQPVTHRAKAARGQPLVRPEEVEILRRPHLVLANLGADDRIGIAGQREQPLNRVLRGDHLVIARIGEALLRAPAIDPRLPAGQVLRLARAPCRDQLVKHHAAITDDRQIHRNGLVDAGPVDVDMDLDRVGRKGIEPACHPVIKPCADADDQVRLVHRPVGLIGAVHPQHPQPIGMVSGKSAKAHQRRGDRRAGDGLQLAQGGARGRTRVDHPAAGIEHWCLGIGDQLDSLCDLVCAAHRLGRIALAALNGAVSPDGAGDLHILGDVDQHRARAAGCRDLKGLVDDGGQRFRVFDEVIMLCAMARDADGIGLLKRVRADQRGWHLPRDHDQRDRIEESIGDAGDGVGGTRARCHQHDARLAGRARIALGRVGGGGFMAHEDVADAGVLKQGIVNRQHRAARIAEHEFDPLALKAVNEDLGAAALLTHGGILFVACARGPYALGARLARHGLTPVRRGSMRQ